MENYLLNKDITVFYVTADSFPAGIINAHETLHKLLPTGKGRNFFGLSRPEGRSGIVYRAAVEEAYAGEGAALGCGTLVIRKGTYTSMYITDVAQHPETIKAAFDVLLAHPQLDEQGYCVEHYTGNDVRCMVRLNYE